MKKPAICRYCGGIIRLVPAADVYGSSTERLGMQNEYLYQCQNCNARVGCHKGTTRPLGDVANEILRLKRIEAHQVFDAYWPVSYTHLVCLQRSRKKSCKPPWCSWSSRKPNGQRKHSRWRTS